MPVGCCPKKIGATFGPLGQTTRLDPLQDFPLVLLVVLEVRCSCDVVKGVFRATVFFDIVLKIEEELGADAKFMGLGSFYNIKKGK